LHEVNTVNKQEGSAASQPALKGVSAYDVIILGAGAAGLICALTAGQRGRRVLVLEKANKTGKKILMSGGGRCNFTNNIVEPEHFLSNNSHFCIAALSRYTQWDFIALVEKHGIDYEQRKHGQLFCTHTAKDILAMLLRECEHASVTIETHCEVSSVQVLESANDEHPCYQLELTMGPNRHKSSVTHTCESLVIATGALSVPSLGGSGMGYDIARQFNLPITERRAGLVPFMFSDRFKLLCERLSGLATAVEVSCNGQSFTENILFTHRGLSGPAILQISNYWRPGDEVSIDLLPGIHAPEWLLQLKRRQGKSRLKNLLTPKLAKALVVELQNLWWPELADSPLAQFKDEELTIIGAQLNDWRLKPSASEGYRTAEVTLGGIDTAAISSKTMETRQQSGLFFIGEVLDVTGHLGGFNFQWAWSSGYSAGLFV